MEKDQVVVSLIKQGVLSVNTTEHIRVLIEHPIVKQAHVVFPNVFPQPCVDVWDFLIRYAKAFPTTTVEAELKHVTLMKATFYMEAKLLPILGDGRLLVAWQPVAVPAVPAAMPTVSSGSACSACSVTLEEHPHVRAAKRKLVTDQRLLDYKRRIVADGTLMRAIEDWKTRMASPDASTAKKESLERFPAMLEQSFGIKL